MITLTYVTTLSGGSLAVGARVTDFAMFPTVTGTFLYAGAQPGMGLLAFSVGAGRAASFTGAFQYSAGADAFGPTRLDLITFGNTTALMTPGRFPAEMGGPTLSSTGAFISNRTFADGTGPGGDVTDLEVLAIGADDWIYGTRPGFDGIGVWRLPSGSTSLQAMPALADDAFTHLAGISAMTSLTTAGGQRWLVVGSGTEQGVTALAVAGDGSLSAVGSVGADDGLGINAPTAIRALDFAGAAYVVVAGAGSSSLSVMRIDATGLVPTDHVTDTLDTRFQSVTAVDTVMENGRAWVFAGGADDGISVFQLLPGGRLVLAATLADTAQMPLAGVAAIRAVAVGGEIQVFVSSGTEDGIAQFVFTPGPPGVTLNGGAGAETLTGGAGEDVILGGGGNDALSGWGGDDILLDGAGADTLTGGAGRDLFVLCADGARDLIADFDPAFDRLDLSDLPLLYAIGQVVITPTATGAILDFGGEQVEIVTASLSPLMPQALTSGMILNLPRSPVQLILNGRIAAGTPGADTIAGTAFADSLSGGAGADSLWGGLGDDRLDGGAGADTLNGGPGFDLADYAGAAAGVTASLGQPGGNAGDAAGDVCVAVEGLAGGGFDDTLGGDAGANLLLGGGGNDALTGGGGDDTLDGGAGDDRLAGGAGQDSLTGGAGIDTADYAAAAQGVTADLSLGSGSAGEATGDTFSGIENLTGSGFADTLAGDGGANVLSGLAGNDRLTGGAGNDTLFGGAGSDTIDGGTGTDLASYADAAAGVTVDMVTPGNGKGWGAGDVFLGVESLLGSDFNDDLRGDAAANALSGGLGDDWLLGRGGNDTLLGGDGNDAMIGGTGADFFDGGPGQDKAHYTDAASGVTADLMDPLAGTGIAAGDVFVSVEGFTGSNFNDVFLGDNFDNQIDGGLGNDRIDGRGGNDWLVGRAGNDTLDGGDGNDLLFGGPGGDRFIGGLGVDRVSYGDSTTGLTADLLTPSRNTGMAVGDSYSGIEELQGSPANDILGGDNAANTINGAKGNDRIDGRGGADYLIGLDGNDTLSGGAGDDSLLGGIGADTFLFNFGDAAERVLDFASGQDRLGLSAAISGIAGMTGAAVVAAYATVQAGDTVFDFGGGDTLVVKGIANPASLAGDIFLF
ncbi:MAG: hypothetical protein ACKVPY_13335 [Paracoccaceae bacterium]